MGPKDIEAKSDNRSKIKAARQNIKAKLYKVEDNKILYTVTSSEGDKQYLVKIQLLSLTSDKLNSLKSALLSDLKISCTCPAFLFMGYKYITWHANSGIDKETRSPDKTNPNKEGMACKHILVALEQMKSDYNAIYSMIKAQVPADNQQSQKTDIKDNNKSDSPTALDIQIITDFKAACDKLYNDYNKFKNSNPAEDEIFADSKFYDKSDPSAMLLNLSKPVSKSLIGKFIGKLKSLDDILSIIDQKKNGFNILLKSETDSLIKKLNSTVNNSNEAYINNIILSIMNS